MREPIPAMQPQHMQRIAASYLTLICVIWNTLLNHSSVFEARRLDTGSCCHHAYPSSNSKNEQQPRATGSCEHTFLQAFSHDERTIP